jgi:hypothetical protein
MPPVSVLQLVLCACAVLCIGRVAAEECSSAPACACDLVVTPPKVPGSSVNQPHSVFQINLSRRLCALQRGALQRPPYLVKLDRADSKAGWAWHVLVLTSALTEAYTRDQPLEVDFSNVPSFRKASTTCDAPQGCFFDGFIFADTAYDGRAKAEVWDRSRLQAHYLQGAGLVWLRQRTISLTGCHLAATFLSVLLRPSRDMGEMISYVSEQLASTRKPGVLFNANSTRMTTEERSAAFKAANGTIWVLGGTTNEADDLKDQHAGLDIQHVQLPQGVSTEILTLFKAFAVSFASHYIGDLDELWVKVGLLYRLGRYHAFPLISSGSSLWKDDYGFASCTAEEFRVQQKAAQGALYECSQVACAHERKLHARW